MISEHSLNLEWINEIRKRYPRRDPTLIEKMIRAFCLVENLQLSGLDFTFKGGTALSLLLGTVNRFSIDIDIVINQNVDLSPYFQTVIEKGVFSRWEETFRTGKIPKRHFKFNFPSLVQEEERYILLDVLTEENKYAEIITLPLKSALLHHEDPEINLCCPSISAILGDKLTAFAPNTTGIPYQVDKDLEIAKQLFDIAILYEKVEDLKVVSETFHLIAEQELTYRGLHGKTPKDVLFDIIETSVMIGTRGEGQTKEFAEIMSGVSKLRGYILSGILSIETAIVYAGKAALLATCLLTQQSKLPRYNSHLDMRIWVIEHKMPIRLNKLKKSNPEAFFYFYHVDQLLLSGLRENAI